MGEEVVNWNIEEKSHEFLDELYDLLRDYEGKLPNLRNIFRPEAIDWILTESVDRNDDSIVDFVVDTGYKDEPKVDKGGNPLLRRTTPIHLVPECRRRPIVSKLFQIYDRFDVNYADESGITHFHLACQFGCDDVVKKFLELGQEPNCIAEKKGHSPLHLALLYYQREVARLLLENDADPTLPDAEGMTPLHVACTACEDRDNGTAEMLLKISNEKYQPVQSDARDKSGNTPLHLATYFYYENLIEFLLKNGADPNAANEKGSTPLHIICKNHYNAPDFLEIFFKTNKDLDQLVQVDARDKFGRTPLQWAVANLMPQAVDLLLNNGADLSSFVFPTENYFADRLSPWFSYNKLILTLGALAVVDSLEKRGYELSRSNALIIMKLFAEHGLFENSVDLEKFWNDDKEFTSKAKEIMITTDLSIYDLVQLQPEDAAKVLTHSDYFKFRSVERLWNLLNSCSETCDVHLCEKLSRRFFRRCALDAFLELTRYQLPILCCEMIIDESFMNQDLYHICLAAAGQKT